MGAKFTVHEVTLGKDNDTSEGEFRIKLPDGRMIGMFSMIDVIKVYIPHGDTPECGYEVVEITPPRTLDDIRDRCDQTDGETNFTVAAYHRHY